jgi:DnaJ family protein A protein 5
VQHVVPDWAKTREPDHDNVGGFSDSEEEVVEEIECVVCGKTFKSEKQFETHERSKKHVKAVQELQREMRRENEALNLDKSSAEDEDDLASDLDELGIHDQEEPLVEPSTAPESVDEIEASIPDAKDENQPPGNDKKLLDASSSSSDQGDDEYAPRKTVESRLANSLLPEEVDSTPAASDGDAGQKVGKAKLKRAKRAAKQEQFVQESQEAQFKCTTCSESFPSKTKLFAHIEKFPKHAQLVSKSAAKQGKGKKKM